MSSSTSRDRAPMALESKKAANMYRRTTCRLCDSPDVDLVLSLTPTPPVDAFVKRNALNEAQECYPLDLFLCRACGHAQLLDVVAPEILFGNYIYETSSSPGLVDHFRRYADEVLAELQPPVESLAVDIGSNDGTLLRFFKHHKLSVVGIDPAGEIARKATASGIETKTAFFGPEVASAILEEKGSARIVTANNVFAHKDNLGNMLDGVRILVADDGVFVFEVSYVLDMINGMIFDLIYHEHLSYHSVKSLARFMRLHGMELIGVKPNLSKGGSLRCFAQRAGGPRPVSKTVGQMVDHEDRIGLDRPEIYRRWSQRIDDISTRVGDYIRTLRSEKKKVAGYGASATGTVLTYHMGLGDSLEFLVDDIPERQSRFSPGHHIPVLSSEALYERRPEFVLILAWRFSDMIIGKHQRYREQGGQFIIPLPELRGL